MSASGDLDRPADRITTSAPPMPGPVRCARALLVGVAGWHLAVPIAALANRDALRRTILLTRPSLDPAGLSAQLTHDLTLAVAVHAPLLLLTCFLIWKLPTAHPFILRPTTASQAFGIVFSTISATPLVALQTLIPLSLTLQLGVILLLWLPQDRETILPLTRRHGFGEN